MDTSIDISIFQSISGNGKAFTAFGYVLAADRGVLALMPWTSVSGNLSDLIHACPVPYQEVLLSIDAHAKKSVDFTASYWSHIVHGLTRISAGRWCRANLPDLHASLFEHDSGLKIVLADELIYRKSLNNELK